MLFLLMAKLYNSIKFFNKDWDDFFDPCKPDEIFNQKIETRKHFEGTHTYVRECSFIKCNSANDGGAIDASASLILLVESSVFDECTTTSTHGGAINYKNFNGNFVCHMVCGYKCNCLVGSSLGQFLYSLFKSDRNIYAGSQQTNTVNDSSVVFSFNENSGAKFTLDIAGGNITVQRVNLTSNSAGSQTAFRCYPAESPNSAETITNINTFTLTFSSFVNNSATNTQYGYNCFDINVAKSEKYIYYCNIIKNSQITNVWGLLRCSGETIINNCCMLENKCKILIHNVDRSHQIKVINCSIGENIGTSGQVQKGEKVSSFVLAIQHLNTANCVAQYDVIGDVPTVEITRAPTENKFVYTSLGNIAINRNAKNAFDIFAITSLIVN